jgi:tRNA nucleotidyltransferase (CCA-adding enzyme)
VQTYLVGGAVRDALMGLRVQDRDWMVVGASPQQMLDQGFMAVGQDFPVFLHPTTHEEYALARTERKTAPGYKGFAVHAAPDVTLEEDLGRRDLTINSIAVSADCVRADGTFDVRNIVDPFHGSRDIEAKVLRHTTAAFAEDPVRILRLARFAARFADFSVDAHTLALMQTMVAAGEADHLVAERVWQELARGLMERQPSRLFAVLSGCGALERLLPELDTSARAMAVLDGAASIAAPLAVRFACLAPEATDRVTPSLDAICHRLRVPSECHELAALSQRAMQGVQQSEHASPADLLDILELADSLRRPARFEQLLMVCALNSGIQNPHESVHYAARLRCAAQARAALDAGAVAQRAALNGAQGQQVARAIRQAGIEAITARLLSDGDASG